MDRERVLRAALLKLHEQPELPASSFSSAQCNALDRFARQTKAIAYFYRGRSGFYRIDDPLLFEAHLRALSPQAGIPIPEDLPPRARHIAYARDSKAGKHQHGCFYPLLKAVGEDVAWQREDGGESLSLGRLTRQFGAASVRIEPADDWRSEQALWLVENQALFDRTDWLPAGTQATLLYYGGQIDGRLLEWLRRRPRASRIVLFPDYDGAGLANYARLCARLGGVCEFWLMPDWERKLQRYGNRRLWQDTLREFNSALRELDGLQAPEDLRSLVEEMRQQGLALEQEAVWLKAGG